MTDYPGILALVAALAGLLCFGLLVRRRRFINRVNRRLQGWQDMNPEVDGFSPPRSSRLAPATMNGTQEFVPDGFEAETTIDGVIVRLRFYRDDGPSVSILLRRGWVPTLLGDLQTRIDPSHAQGTMEDSLSRGNRYRATGISVRRSQTGVALQLSMDFDGLFAAVPVELTVEEARRLAGDLIRV